MRVLVAHESARVRARLQRLGERFRACQLDVVASAAEVASIVRVQQPDLVVLSACLATREAKEVVDAVSSEGAVSTMIVGAPAGTRLSRGIAPLTDPAERETDASGELALLLLAFTDWQTRLASSPRRPGRTASARQSATPSAERQELTDREHHILKGLAAGATTSTMAHELGIAEGSVDSHVAQVVEKLHRRAGQPARP